jgi:hypothetical protein
LKLSFLIEVASGQMRDRARRKRLGAKVFQMSRSVWTSRCLAFSSVKPQALVLQVHLVEHLASCKLWNMITSRDLLHLPFLHSNLISSDIVPLIEPSSTDLPAINQGGERERG